MEVRGLPTCAPELPAGDAPLEALALRYKVDQEALDGWTIATNLTRSGCRIVDPGLRFYAERLAARAVLQKAARLVGPLQAATHTVREPLLEPWVASSTWRRRSITCSASRTRSGATGSCGGASTAATRWCSW